MSRLHVSRREVFSVPNLICYARIALMPVFVALYLRARTTGEFLAAAVLAGVIALSDLLDGWIARRFHQVTELGKFLDPLSDKLMRAALAFCLASRYPLMWWMVALFVLKEGYMGLMGLLLLRRNGRKLDGAKWFGKLCTALLYACMFLLLAVPGLPAAVVQGLIWLCMAAMLLSALFYIPVFSRLWRMEPLP